jgi:hypothetical protein
MQRAEAEQELAKTICENAAKRHDRLFDVEDADDFDLVCDVRENIVAEKVTYETDFESLVSAMGDVCVDMFLTDDVYEEWNHDCARLGMLVSQYQNDELEEDEPTECGLTWFMRRSGLDPVRVLTHNDESEAARRVQNELANAQGAGELVCVLASMPFSQWLEAACALLDDDKRERPKTLVIEGHGLTAGLFDPWSGGGSVLEMDVEEPFVVSTKHVYDLALDERNLTGTRVQGYSIHNVYDTYDDAWRKSTLRIERKEPKCA